MIIFLMKIKTVQLEHSLLPKLFILALINKSIVAFRVYILLFQDLLGVVKICFCSNNHLHFINCS